MKRVRWLIADWPISIRAIASRMKSDLFSPEDDDGFIIDRVRDSFLEARYIEKQSFTDVVIDPFGNELEYERLLYKKLEFALFSGFPNIELTDAPRSVNAFTNKLLGLNDFSVAIESLNVDLIKWVEEVQVNFRNPVVITMMQINGMSVEQGVTAKVMLKGNVDVRKAISKFAGNKKYVLDKIKVTIPTDTGGEGVVLDRNGGAYIPGGVFEDILLLLRASIPDARVS